ncbi:hypothetical protein HK097_004543, partial [Rhizophlyctis rosea]
MAPIHLLYVIILLAFATAITAAPCTPGEGPPPKFKTQIPTRTGQLCISSSKTNTDPDFHWVELYKCTNPSTDSWIFEKVENDNKWNIRDAKD